MNKFKLLSHQKNYREEDLLLNVKDLGTDVNGGDVVEIYHPEDDQPRLLLQIPDSKDDINVQKDTISVEQSIAQAFQLRSYKDVIVRKVDPKDVSLEMVEITFKDQYLGRSEMWRLKKSLVNSVVYTNKKIEFCSGSIRCQVYDMWAQGEKMTCGIVTDNTKIVYRSSTSMVYLFIQMSSEMWEFDIYGDLYFERAVNGFLSELFAKWKKEGSNHEVTIVLFSRTYYQANTFEEFPHHMRECIQQDYKGGFYEDFYRVVVQNEQYEDWTPILTHLRQVFHRYLASVLNHHQQEGVHVPQGINCPASQGNFLEVLNISLNVFEKHYLERTFDRTGQVSVVITPGVGVFEVDRELTNITKQRIIDYGVGTDLVCVGEQPLHAVPLLKFHNKRGSLNADDYSMPHTWINLSFYSTNKKIGYGSFVPRIKLPMEIENIKITKKEKTDILGKPRMKPPQEETTLPNSIFDYDAYDAQVFKLPNNQNNNKNFRSLHRTPGRKKSQSNCQSSSLQTIPRVHLKREMSDPDIYHSIDQMSGSYTTMGSSISSLNDKSPAINIPARITESKTYSRSFGALNVEAGRLRPCNATLYEGEELSPPIGTAINGAPLMAKIGSSAGTSPTDQQQQVNLSRSAGRPGRSLINPFDPSHVTIKLTSNRRRWIHIFPKDNQGVLIQQHHYKGTSLTSTKIGTAMDPEVSCLGSTRVLDIGSQDSLGNGADQQHQVSSTSSSVGGSKMLDPLPATPSAIPPRLLNSTLNDDVLFRNTSTPQKSGSACSTLTRTPGGSQKISSEKRLLWGATGEQEWTAAMTTGVDWKSLTLPACLPITTDYFPDDRGLKNDYMVKEYSLLPEDMNELCRLGSKKQLTAALVFRELVSQRLAQGFQLILFDESEKADPLNTPLQIGMSPGSFSLMRQRSKNKESSEEYRLSIGRIFHKIRLKGSTIDVTIYTPRHPYLLLKRQYRYRFQAPDMDSYEISWVEFRTERLETYKWNLLDNYIVFCGEAPEYQLTEALKFWCFRVLVVSQEGFRWTTKSIIDSTSETPCDIYNPLTIEEQQTTIEGFLRFMELTVHRLRRPVNARKTKSAAGFRERLGSNRVLERPPRPRAGSKTSERMRYESGNRETHADPTEMKSLMEPEEEVAEESEPKTKQKVTVESELPEIVALLRDSGNGVGFLNRQPGLPTYLFLAADATTWVCDNVEGANTEIMAVAILQSMVEQGLICHASGDQKHPFYHGFFLYFIITGNKDHDTISRDPDTFRSEWHEVQVLPLNHKSGSSSSNSSSSSIANPSRPPTCPVFLQSDLPPHPTWKTHSLYKTGAVDIDNNTKSDRLEWGHLKYHTLFSPLQAYEMIIQWVCATGNIVMELLLAWQRKAQTCGLHIFPVPSDPFALPNSYNSDPLRGPILISLNIDCLGDKGNTELFDQFATASRPRRMHLFQETILQRFGFVPYEKEMHGGDHYQFVHVSGNMFVMIHSPGSGVSVSAAQQTIFSDSITRKRTLSNSTTPVPGFLWTFNYMLTKRWKSSITGDNEVGFSMLHDFRQFCSNNNNRLREFWDSFLPERTLPQDETIDK